MYLFFKFKALSFKCDVIHVDGSKVAFDRREDLRLLSAFAHKGTLWASDDIHASCGTEYCYPVDHDAHCLFKTFHTIMDELGLEPRCITPSVEKDHGQCFAYQDWDMILNETQFVLSSFV